MNFWEGEAPAEPRSGGTHRVNGSAGASPSGSFQSCIGQLKVPFLGNPTKKLTKMLLKMSFFVTRKLNQRCSTRPCFDRKKLTRSSQEAHFEPVKSSRNLEKSPKKLIFVRSSSQLSFLLIKKLNPRHSTCPGSHKSVAGIVRSRTAMS